MKPVISFTKDKPAGRRNAALLLAAALLLIIGSLGVYRLSSGRSLGLRSFLSSRLDALTSYFMAPAGSGAVLADDRGEFTNLIFLHHSVGHNLIAQGNLRETFAAAGLDLWDQDYNSLGLTDPQGNPTGYSYTVPGDNTDPDGLAAIFRQEERGRPTNTLSGLLQHEVIIVKSCFPASNIESDVKLEQYKSWYLSIRETIDRHPDRLFILLSPPPLNPAETTPQAAARARQFANWLNAPEYKANHPNVYTFDLFDALAEPDSAAPDANMLREGFRTGTDSHPNLLANQTVAAQLAESTISAVEEYREIFQEQP